MEGCTMHVVKSCVTEEDEEVSNQLKSMLSHALDHVDKCDEDETSTFHCPPSSSSSFSCDVWSLSPCGSLMRSGTSSKCVSSDRISQSDPPANVFVPSQDNHSATMEGWTSNYVNIWDTVTNENEEVPIPEDLESVLSHALSRSDEYDEEETIHYPALSSSSSCGSFSPSGSSIRNGKTGRLMSTAFIFLVAIVPGVIFVGLSVTFGHTPSQELSHMKLRAHLRKPTAIDNNKDGIAIGVETNTSQQKSNSPTGEEEEGLSEFCDMCQWKHTGFSCRERVEWEQERYAMSEQDAIRANMKHCTSESNPTQQEGSLPTSKEEEGLSKFCGMCQWKHTGFSCRERVKWEQEKYRLSEEDATMANMKHCTMGISSILNVTAVKEDGS